MYLLLLRRTLHSYMNSPHLGIQIGTSTSTVIGRGNLYYTVMSIKILH